VRGDLDCFSFRNLHYQKKGTLIRSFGVVVMRPTYQDSKKGQRRQSENGQDREESLVSPLKTAQSSFGVGARFRRV